MKIQMVLALAGLASISFPESGYAEIPAEKIYGTYCVQCHGLKRNGTGVNLPGLSTKPRATSAISRRCFAGIRPPYACLCTIRSAS